MSTRCPICKQPVHWETAGHRPFCSEHCRMVDLSRWLREDYFVPHENPGEDAGSMRLKGEGGD